MQKGKMQNAIQFSKLPPKDKWPNPVTKPDYSSLAHLLKLLGTQSQILDPRFDEFTTSNKKVTVLGKTIWISLTRNISSITEQEDFLQILNI